MGLPVYDCTSPPPNKRIRLADTIRPEAENLLNTLENAASISEVIRLLRDVGNRATRLRSVLQERQPIMSQILPNSVEVYVPILPGFPLTLSSQLPRRTQRDPITESTYHQQSQDGNDGTPEVEVSSMEQLRNILRLHAGSESSNSIPQIQRSIDFRSTALGTIAAPEMAVTRRNGVVVRRRPHNRRHNESGRPTQRRIHSTRTHSNRPSLREASRNRVRLNRMRQSQPIPNFAILFQSLLDTEINDAEIGIDDTNDAQNIESNSLSTGQLGSESGDGTTNTGKGITVKMPQFITSNCFIFVGDL
ncbi:hypothetical protein BKA69DRAFT_1070607 [Paraphysoderma sedebokerense]|nr:hypothetical protein BKA69DRAFT_1070607 [Paraphysoderma sedebokerense]